jgi:hypothetical protein
MRRILHATALLALGGTALTGCLLPPIETSEGEPRKIIRASEAPADKKAKDRDAKGAGEEKTHEPIDDVKITKCGQADFGGYPEATVEIVNSQDDRRSYFVELEFVAANGDRLADGMASVNSLAPGQKTTEQAMGLGETGGKKFECRLVEVTRHSF